MRVEKKTRPSTADLSRMGCLQVDLSKWPMHMHKVTFLYVRQYLEIQFKMLGLAKEKLRKPIVYTPIVLEYTVHCYSN